VVAPPTFSVVVIVRNEGRAFPRLFASATSFLARGGELLVVDTGSTDDTVAAARAHGARVREVGERFASALTRDDAARIDAAFARQGEGPLVHAGERLFHFAEARQHAGLLARHDHVLQVDAGDEFLAFDVDFVDRAAGRPEAVRLEYRLRLGDASLWISRFYDRRTTHWEGRVHEVLLPHRVGTPAVNTLRSEDGELQIRHHRNSTTTRAYLAGLALDALEHPENPRWLHYLGRELTYHGRHRSAVTVLDIHAARADAWVAERSESLCRAGMSLEALGEPEEAGHRYHQAIVLDGARREPLLRQAALCLRQGDLEGSVTHARRALEISRTSAFVEADTNYGHLPHSLLSWGLFWLGQRAEARDHWEVCRRLAPGHPDVEAQARLFATPPPLPAGG
jgi:glycosyltransferase involved in cell wall biosynthesis